MNRKFLWCLMVLLCIFGIWLFVPGSVFPAIAGFFSIRAVQVVFFIIAFIVLAISLMDNQTFYGLFLFFVVALRYVLHPWTRFIALAACAVGGALLWTGNPAGLITLIVSLVWLALSIWANRKPETFR
jgi:hypothetical protein